jgi:hypothetical protein
MKMKFGIGKAVLLAMGLAGLAQPATAQVFNYNEGDLCLGFRKAGDFQEEYNVVIDIGPVGNYESLSAGTTVNITQYTPTLLAPGCFSAFDNLQWSVIGAQESSGASYPLDTVWVTVPRSTLGVQTTAPTRATARTQQTPGGQIDSILGGAVSISMQVAASVSNSVDFVSEDTENPNAVNYCLNSFMADPGDQNDPTIGNLDGKWTQGNLEQFVPSPPSVVQSDLYEVQPSKSTANQVIVDPHVGTNAYSYYIGYFQFNANGTMTFTRQASVAPPPPAPTLSISLPSGFVLNSSKLTISFPSTNGSTYTLYATNSAGLRSAVTKWPSLGSQTGNGGVLSFQDVITTSNRFYAVTVH